MPREMLRSEEILGSMRLLGGWHEDPLWASVYGWLVEHRRVGGVAWRLGLGSDLGLLYDAVREVGRLPAGSRVLDVPTGNGIAMRGITAGQGLDYVAADISAAMLDRALATARRLGVEDQVTPLVADVGDLPLADASVDLVATFTGLHCFPDPHRAVIEMVRVLRPGGVHHRQLDVHRHRAGPRAGPPDGHPGRGARADVHHPGGGGLADGGRVPRRRPAPQRRPRLLPRDRDLSRRTSWDRSSGRPVP